MDLASSSSGDHDAQWRTRWDVHGTVDWIETRGLTKVALQFPDELLQESTLVAAAVQQECSKRDVAAQVSRLHP